MQETIRLCLIGLSLSAWSLLLVAPRSGSNAFLLEQLPKGKTVTLPQPATTWVRLNARVQFKATDMPQSLSFAAIQSSGTQAAKIRLAIYDRHAERVQYATVRAGVPFIYPLHGLDPITVIPDLYPGTQAGLTGLKLQVESNKPLEMSQ